MLWWCAETTLVAGGLAGLAAAASRFRTIDPSARHLLWLVVLLKFVSPPLIQSPWAVVLPAWTSVENASPIVNASASLGSNSENLGTATIGAEPSPRIVRATWPPPEHKWPATAAHTIANPSREIQSTAFWPLMRFETFQRTILAGWLVGGVLLGLARVVRIHGFQRRIRWGVPAPKWLTDEAERVGRTLGVRVPELLVVAEIGTPMIWCLGRPKLLVPGRLLKSLSVEQWRGVIAHELAHLRRRDHWVRRIELIASLIWWWNPLYWITQSRLDAEAELACDAWVVQTLPEDRLTYAEVLFQICSELYSYKSPPPALGVTGSGLLFERRLNMILRDRMPCRPSRLVVMSACLLTVAAVPSWTMATPAPPTPATFAALVSLDDDKDEKARKAGTDEGKKPKDDDVEASELETSIETTFGPEFEKAIEEWAEGFEKQFGEGSEFAKKMEALGEKMEKEFGEGSEFAKKMEAVGKDLEKKLGPGSEFEAKMKNVGEEIKKKIKEKSKKDAAMAAKNAAKAAREADRAARDTERTARDRERTARDADASAREAEREAKDSARERASEKANDRPVDRKTRIKALEAKIQELAKEIESLESNESEEE